MGMSIEGSCEPTPMSKEEIVDILKTMVFGVQAFERFNAKERETLDKSWNLIDQYENRLKADMVAMLTDIHLEMESLRFGQPPRKYVVDECLDVIQQKIDALKGDQEAADGKD